MSLLYGNDALSILLLSTKKSHSSFLKKFFVFQKICFRVKVLKSFQIFSDCHIKTCRSLKWRAILKIPVLFFRIIYGLSASFKMKPLRKSVFQCWDKNQPKFCWNSFSKEPSFIVTVYLMNDIIQASVLLLRDNGMYKTYLIA